MKKYLIPLGMIIGGLFGTLIGLFSDLGVIFYICVGCVLGIAAGTAAQLVINQIYPDEYFVKKKKKEITDDSLFSEKEIAKREAYTAEHAYKDNYAIEDTDNENYVSSEEIEMERRLRQEEKWREQAERLRARKAAEEKAKRAAQQPKKRSIFEEPEPSKNSGKNKKTVIIEEDDD